MDVGSIFGAITGNKSVKIEVQLKPPENPIVLDSLPSWKLHKSPFWRIQHDKKQKQQPQQQGQQQLMGASPAPLQQPQQLAHQQPFVTQQRPFQAQPPPQQQFQPHPQQFQPQYQQHPSQFQPPVQSQTQTHLPMQRGQLFAYEASQDVSGIVIFRLPMSSSKGIEHLGITVYFVGRISMEGGAHDGKPHYDFVSVAKELAPPGVLYNAETVLPFSFPNMEKTLESYRGRNVAVKYLIKIKIDRKYLPPITHHHEVWVQKTGQPPDHHEAIKMEVGIEDCLHIEFEYERRHYHLLDTITGTIRFLLVSIKLKHMELAVLRRETSGEGVAVSETTKSGDSIFTETQTLVKYEIMDGAPVKGEVIPVKLCLAGIPADLTPTYPALNNRFSVRYFLNLVLVDDDDRRYFKQQEIILWRKELG